MGILPSEKVLENYLKEPEKLPKIIFSTVSVISYEKTAGKSVKNKEKLAKMHSFVVSVYK